VCKSSDKSDKFLLNLAYSKLLRGPLFSGHSVDLNRAVRTTALANFV